MSKKRKILIAILAVVALLLVLLLVIGMQSKWRSSENSYSNADIQVKTYQGENGWGYDIYVDDKLLIHQPHIPVLSGNRGFTMQTDAQKVAELMVGKIKGNIVPPTLTLEDLKSIGIER